MCSTLPVTRHSPLPLSSMTNHYFKIHAAMSPCWMSARVFLGLGPRAGRPDWGTAAPSSGPRLPGSVCAIPPVAFFPGMLSAAEGSGRFGGLRRRCSPIALFPRSSVLSIIQITLRSTFSACRSWMPTIFSMVSSTTSLSARATAITARKDDGICGAAAEFRPPEHR
jgi:hypothetical protein